MSFIKRMLFFFLPSLLALILMHIAGITENLLITGVLLLMIVWMLQATYKLILKRKYGDPDEEE